MKKIRFLALAMTFCLATACFLTGTVAKYNTGDAAEDSATAAKWGVNLEVSGTLFGEKYLANSNTPTEDADGVSVVSSSVGINVVAPGTKSSADGMKIELSGTTEVAVDVKFVITDTDGSDATDVYLAAGTYTDYTDLSINNATFELAEMYYPIKYTLTQTKEGEEPNKLVDGKTLADVVTALQQLTTNCDNIAANTDLAKEIGTLVLTWEWAFEQNKDAADTLLGKLADNSQTDTGVTTGTADYNLTPDIKITVTVTQVD